MSSSSSQNYYKNVYSIHKWWYFKNISLGRCCIFNWILKIIHCAHFVWIWKKTKTWVYFFLNPILVVLHSYISDWLRGVGFFIFLIINKTHLQWHFTLNQKFKHNITCLNLKKKITIAKPKTFSCTCIKYYNSPSMDIYFAIWATGVHVFKIFYLRNYTGNLPPSSSFIILSNENSIN